MAAVVSQSYRREVLCFHRALAAIIGIYWVVYMVLWQLNPYTSIPLISSALIFVLTAFSLMVGKRTSCSETAYTWSLTVVAVGSALAFSLVHPTIQRGWMLPLTQEPQHEFGSDYRTDGSVHMGYFLCFMALFMLRGAHGVVVPPMSAILYQCLLLAGGVELDHVDWLMLGTPVCLCVCGRVMSNRLRGRVDELLRELEEQSRREQGLRIEAEMAVREQASRLRAGIVEEGAETDSFTFSVSSGEEPPQQQQEPKQQEPKQQEPQQLQLQQRQQHQKQLQLWRGQQQQQSPLLPQQELQQEQRKQQEQQQAEHEQQHRQEQQQQEQQERQGQREQQQQAPAGGTLRSLDGGVRGPRFSAATAATAAFREGCAQTDIVWAEQGFRCTRCSRPPRPPAAPGERPSLARPPHQLRPRQRQRRRSKMRRGTQLRIEGAPPTPKPTRQHTLALCCFSWNMRLPRNRCCDMHALLEEASCVLQDLKEQGCKEEDAEVAFYCSSCGIITTDAVEADSDCTNCGGSFIAAPRAGEGDSSSSSDAGGHRRASL